MKSVVVNRTKSRIPRSFIESWNINVVEQLQRRRVVIPSARTELVIVFVSSKEMIALNKEYRGKTHATDILSFVSQDPIALGELVICLDTIKKQAQQHKLKLKEELGYMLLHGVLHLLGFDHEKSEKEARQMFKLQDDVFEELCQSSRHVTTSRIHRDQKKIRNRAHAL